MPSSPPAGPPDDPLGAFCRENHAALSGSGTGPLAGLTFAAKDVFDIAGSRTGFGNPVWLESHPPATATAPAVQCLLDAGADMVAKTITDELTYSLSGQNAHYGTPVNTSAPGRICGGSSSGSASAVAGASVDFALGTDCGGSVRLPASYCGILGIRPSHGRVSLEGVAPFTWSFDVAGWFARDADVFAAVGHALLDGDEEPVLPTRLLYAEDAFGVIDREVADASGPCGGPGIGGHRQPQQHHRQPRWTDRLVRDLQGHSGVGNMVESRRLDCRGKAGIRPRDTRAAGLGLKGYGTGGGCSAFPPRKHSRASPRVVR